MGLFRIRGNGSAFSLALLLAFLFWAAVYYLSQIEWVRIPAPLPHPASTDLHTGEAEAQPFATDNELAREILLAVMASLAKQEAIKISERTKAGLARARELRARELEDRRSAKSFAMNAASNTFILPTVVNVVYTTFMRLSRSAARPL
jgi:hypothetical protein